MHSDLDHLSTLIENKSKIKDLASFHHSVNITFHDIEAKYYDQLHKEMWDSLQPIFNSFNKTFDSQKLNVKVLDVGCGTGLSSSMLINTSLEKSIENITLLDTSSVMLEKAKIRFKNSSIKFDYFNGDIFQLDKTGFDLVLISSVLHHIPDLEFFFKEINKKLNSGGLLFHIHDPNGDAIHNQIYLNRVQQLRDYYKSYNKKISTKIIHKLKNYFHKTKEPNYIYQVNESLLKNNIIHTPLTPQEIWSVTDIHVEDLPYSTKKGISIKELGTLLHNYNLEDMKSYSFFGVMRSKLPSKYVSYEKELFTIGDLNGRNICCIWKKLD